MVQAVVVLSAAGGDVGGGGDRPDVGTVLPHVAAVSTAYELPGLLALPSRTGLRISVTSHSLLGTDT